MAKHNPGTPENIREKIEKFLTDTQQARELSEKCRDYFDHKQWTDGEVVKLRSRAQAPIVVNRIKPKIEGLVGLYNLRKSDPKAYARTEKHEEASHVITDAIRYVAENNDFESVRQAVAEDFFVEGYGGVIVDLKQKKDDIETNIRYIPWDRIYFDPHSRAKNFEDSRWMGIILWMYEDEAQESFPNVDIEDLIRIESGGTFEDRPHWFDAGNHRIRIALHFEIHKSVWHMAVISGDNFLVKFQKSPFLDDEGDPTNPIELVSANVARDNSRYGEALGFLDLQDEINHRRSKFLHMLNSRQTFGRKGAQEDVVALKRELQKPDGHIEFEGDEFGKDFGVMPSTGAEIGQFNLYLDGKAELDSTSFNSEAGREATNNNLSGIALGKIQQSETIELNRQFGLLSNWELRVYRQEWGRIKQSWDKEKWIRVTDDQDNLRWVGFNTPMTVQEVLEEKINDESEPIHVRRLAAQSYTQMLHANDPKLQELVEVRNPIPELDIDIILDQTFDTINAQDEQFQMLAQFASSGDVDIIDLIEISQLRGKDDLIEKIQKRRQEAQAAQGGALKLAAEKTQADTELTQVKSVKEFEEAKQKQVETELLIRNPDPQPQVNT